MRKFLNRLATGGVVDRTHGGTVNDEAGQRSVGVSSDESAGLQEKVGLNAREFSGTGERVRALAARYETMSATPSSEGTRNSQPWLSRAKDQHGDGQAQTAARSSGARRERSPLFNLNKALPSFSSDPATTQQGQRPSTLDLRLPEASAGPSSEDMLPAVLGASTDNSVLRGQLNHAGTAAHSEGPSSHEAQQSVSSMPAFPASALRPFNESRQVSSSSADSGNGSSTVHHAPQKSVVFAPSPKKPTRPTSPVMPMPERAAEDVARYAGGGTSGGGGGQVGNFAKPTLASTARSRIGGKQGQATQPSGTMVASQSSGSAPLTSSASRQGTEKFPTASTGPSRPSSGLSNGTKMRRSNSASTSGRRGATGSSGIPAAGASSVSLVHSTRDGAVHLPNSIPFVSSSTLGMLRSASPLSFGTTSSTSGIGAVPDFLGSSRRASFQGRHHSGGSSKFASTVRSIGAPSWSEMTQDDIVNNLGSRERTRQEVLWEIVASEERYIQELEKTKELYIDALLHPHRFSPPSSPGTAHAATLAALEGRNHSGPRSRRDVPHRGDVPSPNNADLPIAARYMNSCAVSREGENAPYGSIDAAALSHAASQKRLTTQASHTPTRSRPQSQSGVPGASQASLVPGGAVDASNALMSKKKARQASDAKEEGALKRWSQRQRKGQSAISVSSTQVGYDLTNGQGGAVNVPAPLRNVLEAIDNGISEGHALLSEALRLRYEEQWPLVRSLADVFTRFSYVLKHYRPYVLHLERALDCLEEAALMERAMRGKRIRKDRLSVMVGLGRAVASLEAAASEQGECGLAIFLAMPFQRLLKYPLLFQNLLFHTDASTFEFESTVQMVVDVERIVRSIEDDKINKEERDKTIDAFARIEGIKDKALMRPKADRMLIEERAMYQENPRRALSESNDRKGGAPNTSSSGASPDAMVNTAMSTPLGVGSGNLRASIRSKRSYRRLSDLLTLGPSVGPQGDEGSHVAWTKAPNMGSKRDIWLVRFSDVELRCQRVGMTALPMVSSAALHPSDQAVAPFAGSEGQTASAEPGVMTEDEAKMRDEFKRTRESKERMRALRNTTLRSKTRNLYKFLGVSSWKATREKPNMEDADGMDGLATAHEADELEEEEEEEEEELEDEEDEDGGSGDESSTSQETDGGLLDHEHYIRQSKLSFSYGGNDRVEPKLSMASGSLSASRSAASHGHGSGSKGRGLLPPQKRHSMGSTSGMPNAGSTAGSGLSLSRSVVANSKARTDKFGSRLRADDHHQRRGSMPNVVSSNAAGSSASLSRFASRTRDVNGEDQNIDEEEVVSQQHVRTSTVHEGLLSVPDRSSSMQDGKTRASLLRDQSFDSNLRLMGSLIQPSHSSQEF